MEGIDRKRIQQSFSRQAEEYDSYAVVQKRVVERFLDIFVNMGASPARVLDVGVGTGSLLQAIKAVYPNSMTVGFDLALGMLRESERRLSLDKGASLVCGDGENLPFDNDIFDLVVSTSTYQWINPVTAAFGEAWRVLKPGGRFCIAFFGEKTLFELRHSYQRALVELACAVPFKGNQFATMQEAIVALSAAGFTEIRQLRELEVETHSDVYALIKSLKRIGAGTSSAIPLKGLGGRRLLAEAQKFYLNEYGGNSLIPATYDVIYCSGTKQI